MDFLSFGEILFDVFKDEAKLGGAPLNVASHMKKLGLDGLIISAVGNDELGERALEEVKQNGLSTEGVKISSYPTGRADITLVNNNADYTFNFPCAWDDVTLETTLPKSVDIIYFGSLVQREKTSRETLKKLLAEVEAKYVFFDVNIRKRFYTEEILREGLKNANILKVNDEEIDLILNIAGAKDIRDLMDKCSLEMLLLTLGKNGSTIYTKSGEHHMDSHAVKLVDTVGAGDSLSAGFLSTLVMTGDPALSIKVGATLADYVCSQRGAIPAYSDELVEKLKALGIKL
ncbi:MAG: carbohydrate kinase [Sphaerochaetaceae bacterium]|nr:carbohydrate kinase [Sphaerochaetaceae bacterium]